MKGFMAGALGLALSVSAGADVVFENATTDRGIRFDPGTAEVGNQIFLTSSGYVTNFAIEYWGTGPGGSPTFAGALVQMRVRWYLNDGLAVNGYASPGTLEYDSNWNTIMATSAATLRFTTPPDFPRGLGSYGLFIPSRELTVTVQFRGMASGNQAGLELFGPPSIGNEYADYWMRDNSAWQLMADTNGLAITFGMEFMSAIPEPSSLAICLVGGVGLFMAVWRPRKGRGSPAVKGQSQHLHELP